MAVRVDTLSILSFQDGLFGWMVFGDLVIFSPALAVDTASHWRMMQIGMMVGCITAWPMNRVLIARGIKENMDDRTHLARRVASGEQAA